MRTVIIVDYGVGNLRSVARAVTRCGATPILATTPEQVAQASIMILPGVGAFGSCVAALKAHGLAEPVLQVIASGRPVLGICVGMQMLMNESEEFGQHAGLGLISGTVKAIPNTGSDGTPHKIPHIGWNGLHPASGDWAGSIFEDVQPGEACYFVHSFAAQADHAENDLAHCEYNGRRVCAAVRKDNLTGVQFHPEKSGPVGLKILSRFIAKA
ncbi:imidazole glycerol phosphate synthase subunit HisH [Bradyrhizobium sp. AUGA SZCCT0158]|uniref:imidazole glycerol phosphate synthase subunit HisH n=1 Tax=Bradyrhizobium sp. AUGA SZCCT0158 TaxID=2807661 RepID=UPI001BA89B74|nr:imidazole glycerol phosphate synthase subunit HisH [Bradyrhizobium sp. AUGA SZCCT0158]MBR1199482.1 imidazole glycerol phosphate synthase subunit HisH [Bradyrhizobium sp. AUGA SZCCT0158]